MKSITSAAERKELISSDDIMSMEHLLPKNQVKNIGLYGRVVLKPLQSVEYHVHTGEIESYYILSGTGLYNDNGNTVPVKAGDVTYTADGNGHGITNNTNEDLVFLALIVKQ